MSELPVLLPLCAQLSRSLGCDSTTQCSAPLKLPKMMPEVGILASSIKKKNEEEVDKHRVQTQAPPRGRFRVDTTCLLGP